MIPKKIHYCWVGESPLPKKDRACIESWRRFCPDYEIIEWNESNYDFSKCAYMRQAYAAKMWGFVPDYARLDIVYREGGIYLDTDVQLIRSLDPLLKYEAFAGFESRKHVALGLGFGAERKNPVIRQMRDQYEGLSFCKEDGTPNLVPSPVYATQALTAYGLKADGKRQTVAGMEVFPSEYFAPLRYVDGRLRITENTYSIHWYHASWHTPKERRQIRQAQKVNRIFGPYLGKFVAKGLRGACRAKKFLHARLTK